MIEPFSRKISPYRTVFFLIEETFFQSFHYLFLSLEISIRLIIYLIETNSHLTVSLVKSGIHPIIHHSPQSTYFRISRLPFHQHFTGFIHQWRSCLRLFLRHALLHQRSYFRFIMLIERDIIIPNQVISLFTG